MSKYTKQFMKFLDATPNAYYATRNISEVLNKEGFTELKENVEWNLIPGKYYVTRNNASILAFTIPEKPEKFLMVASHSDSPCYHLKTNAEMLESGYLKLNVEPYGGMLDYTWFDRPLSVSGRVITKKNNQYKINLVNIDKDIFVIPSLCAHQASNPNGFKPNPQKELLPVLGLYSEKGAFEALLKEQVDGEIIDSDLYLYCRDTAKLIGAKEDFILSPRIDNLGSAFGTLYGFIQAKNEKTINLYACFNNEESGSLTVEGADSTFLDDTIERICEALQLNSRNLLNSSFMVSADNGHAVHPNYPEKCDPTNRCRLNKGIVIKHHTNYTTSGLSSAVLKGILQDANVAYQDFSARSDGRNGGTLGKISLKHVSVQSVDIGMAQLAMHSANETCGSEDIDAMIDGMKAYFESDFTIE